MNRELKDYLYYLTGKILTYEDKKKILVYFEKLHQENIRLKHKNKTIKKAIEYINSDEMLKLREDFEYCNDKDLFDEFTGHLDRILRRSDKE